MVESDSGLKYSKVFGTNWKNQRQFDDTPFIIDLGEDVKVGGIELYSTTFLAGLQIFYDNGQLVSNDMYIANDPSKTIEREDNIEYYTNKNEKIKSNFLKIDKDDKISKVILYAGDIIDGIEFCTNNGKSAHGGGYGGSKLTFDCEEMGLDFVGIKGSIADISQGNYYWTVHSLVLIFKGKGEIKIK